MNGLGVNRLALSGVVFLCLAVAVGTSQPADAPWVFDVVRLKSGAEFRGLILNETTSQLSFVTIRRQQGRPTVCLPTSFAMSEVEKVTPLSKTQRDQLSSRIDKLQNEPVERELRLKQLELKPIEWEKKGPKALQYRSDWFVFESDAPELIARRASVRLEEIHAAFGRFIAPRASDGKTTTIRLMRSCEEYKKQLRAQGRNFDNAGYYDPKARIIVCASDLERLGDDMFRVKKDHLQWILELDRREAVLSRIYKGSELLRHIQPIRDSRRDVDVSERKNEAIFAQCTRSIFALLAHEAFHAYVDTGADLPPNTQLPRWLNEGLAQIFESAIVEGGELRLGHADPERLKRVKEMTRQRKLIPLADVLLSRPEQFQNDHASRTGTAEQRYFTVWALAMYLTFDRQLVGGRDFNGYLTSLAQGKNALDAFGVWFGKDLKSVGRDWHQYLIELQVDGTRAKLEGEK